MVSNLEKRFVCQDLVILIKRVELNETQKRQAFYYNMKRRELDFKVGDFVLPDKHWLHSHREKRVVKFLLKFMGSFKVLGIVNNSLIIDIEIIIDNGSLLSCLTLNEVCVSRKEKCFRNIVNLA